MDKYSNSAVNKGASKIGQLAVAHGMTCRRLIWNPNYKGIDDWQLALFRKNVKKKEAMTIISEQQLHQFRVYQLNLEGIKTYPFAFRSIKAMHKAGYQQPPAADYRLVYDGTVTCARDAEQKVVLQDIYDLCNDAFPDGYLGHSLSMSDVVELYNEEKRSYFYCDEFGFTPVQFAPELAKPMPSGERHTSEQGGTA